MRLSLSQLGHEAFLISVPNTKYLAPGNKKLKEGGSGEAQGSVLECLPPTMGGIGIEKIQALHKYFLLGKLKSQWNLSCL